MPFTFRTSRVSSSDIAEYTRSGGGTIPTVVLMLFLASLTLVLSACGNFQIGDPIIEVQTAQEVSPTDAPESPLSGLESPLSTSAFESPLVIEGTAQVGFGGLGGRVFNTDLDGVRSPYANTPIRLAAVFLEPQTNEKLFILSGAESPGTQSDADGYFLFDALAPGEYVMLVGDVIGYHQIIAGADEQAQIYVIAENEVLNAGVIDVELP